MKTDDLIALMTRDAPVKRRYTGTVWMCLAAGAVISALLLLATVGIRKDIGNQISTPAVAFKILETLALVLIAGGILFPVGRPDGQPASRIKLLVLPALALFAAIVGECLSVPTGDLSARWIGAHPLFCLFFIPVLSLAPLVALFIALRQGAPADPGRAGAAAGLAASAIAAALYAWHCTDDSPLFVASWYGAAILVVTGVGFAAGRRLLRW